jgi:hypothetical protein
MVICSILMLCVSEHISAQNDGVWRVLQRNSYYEGYDYNEGDWTPHNDYTREIPYYLSQYTDVIDSICAKHRSVIDGVDSGWNNLSTVYYNPIVIQNAGGKSVTYNIRVGQSDVSLYWNGHYDTQNRLVEYNSTRIHHPALLVTTHENYFYSNRNEPDSIYKHTYDNYVFGHYQKTINVYDSLDRKTTELVYTSDTPLSWQLTKRVLLYYSNDMYPDGFYFKTHNPMFLQRMGYFPGSCLDNNFSGLTTPYIVDSLCIQVWQDSIWVDDEYDYYDVNYYTPGYPQIRIEQWETEYIPPPPDFQPPRYSIVFNPNGLFISEGYSIDDGFSPPSYSGISYTWEYYVPNEDNAAPAVAGLMLRQNYPNPFSKSTSISFNNCKNNVLNLNIYNIRGQLVKTLLDRASFKSGEHSANWDGTDNAGKRLAAGIYFYKLSDDKESVVRKMLLLK